jgi:hypothetical protein
MAGLMGLFGGKSSAMVGGSGDLTPPGSSLREKIMAAGAMMSGDTGLALQIRQMGAQRAKEADRQDFLTQLAQMASPSTTPGTPAIAGMQGPGVDGDPIGHATPATAPTTIPGLNMNDPRMAAISILAEKKGIPLATFLDVLKAQQPNVQYDRGFGYNQKTGDPAGGYHPDLDKGQTPAFGPNGQVVGTQLLPGALSAASNLAGGVANAQETAKAGLDLVDVPRGDGSSVKMTRLDAARLLASRSSGGGQGGGPPVGTMLRAPLGVSQSPNDATYGNEQAKNAATAYEGMQASARKAPSEIAKYQRLGDLLGGYEGGKFSPALKDFSSAANSLGFNIDKNLPNKEAAAAITNQLALSLRDPSNGGGMPGAMSDADRNFLVQSVPGLVQTAAGRKSMVQAQVKVLQRNQDVGAMARKWSGRFGRIDKPDATGKTFQDYLDAWATAHPLFTGQ